MNTLKAAGALAAAFLIILLLVEASVRTGRNGRI